LTDEDREDQRLQEIFDNFFKERPAPEQAVYKGRLTELAAFESEHFHTLYEPGILTNVKARINGRLRSFGKLIQPPHGPATIHFDYIDGTISNGLTFVKEGVYFIGVTSRMLLDFEKASASLTGRASVRDLLVAPIDASVVRALCNTFFAIQLQFTVFHELGHIFHAHCDARAFREEYRLSPMEKLLLLYPDQDLEQAKEFLADRYAVRMLLEDLIATATGASMHAQIASALPQDECIVWLILLSIGSSFFFGPSERFHPPLARKRDHPFDLARLNIVMRSIVEWSQSVGRTDLAEWASSTQNFEWVTACIQDAASMETKREDWIAQGHYLKTDLGRDYLDIIYNEKGVVTQDMVDTWWKVQPSDVPTAE
jgi:hypothetical protein